MSQEAAVAFYERLEMEPELQEKIKAMETPERVQVYVREELGYAFTKEEMQRVIFERHPEMTDAAMAAVVGGLDAGWYVLAGAAGGATALILIVAGAAAA